MSAVLRGHLPHLGEQYLLRAVTEWTLRSRWQSFVPCVSIVAVSRCGPLSLHSGPAAAGIVPRADACCLCRLDHRDDRPSPVSSHHRCSLEHGKTLLRTQRSHFLWDLGRKSWPVRLRCCSHPCFDGKPLRACHVNGPDQNGTTLELRLSIFVTPSTFTFTI